jgi:hypothetical protein
MRELTLMLILAAVAAAQTATLANHQIELTISERGAALVNLILLDDAEKLSPLWSPAGRSGSGTSGHFLCVDGFGSGSAEERAAGLPGHGEAHAQLWQVSRPAKDGPTAAISFHTHLPLVQENLTRTFRLVDGENAIYVESALVSEVGFDRPISWAEHVTFGSPFLQPGVTVSSISGSRAQSRPYEGKGSNGMDRRLASGQNFTWPLAPGLDGKPVDLTALPQDPHYVDHAAILVDPGLTLGWTATVNTVKHLVIGYIFKREEYPWVQNWGSYPANGNFARGLELSTQPYDEPRREAVAKNGMFGAPTFRWLPAKATIHSSFLLFYAHTPDGFGKVESVRLEQGQIVVEDGAKKRIALAASLPL